MPVMDGMQATPIIRRIETRSPIVAMTANIMIGDIDQYKKLGMDDYIGKPFTSQELWRCLLKFLTPVKFQDMGIFESKKDTMLIKQLKIDFVRDNRESYEEIEAALITGDISLAYRLAHSLKSSAAMIGAQGLQKIADDVEASLKDGKNRTTTGQMETLRSLLFSTLTELEPYLESIGEEKHETETADFDLKKARELIDTLEPLLKNGNTECLDFVDGLRAIPGSGELIQQIEDFYFCEASELLKKLKDELEGGQWKNKKKTVS